MEPAHHRSKAFQKGKQKTYVFLINFLCKCESQNTRYIPLPWRVLSMILQDTVVQICIISYTSYKKSSMPDSPETWRTMGPSLRLVTRNGSLQGLLGPRFAQLLSTFKCSSKSNSTERNLQRRLQSTPKLILTHGNHCHGAVGMPYQSEVVTLALANVVTEDHVVFHVLHLFNRIPCVQKDIRTCVIFSSIQQKVLARGMLQQHLKKALRMENVCNKSSLIIKTGQHRCSPFDPVLLT